MSAGEEHHHINEETRPPRLVPLVVPDDADEKIDESTLFPKEYEGHLDIRMISNDAILARTKKVAELINEDYKNERPVFVVVLKGASTVRKIPCPS